MGYTSVIVCSEFNGYYTVILYYFSYLTNDAKILKLNEEFGVDWNVLFKLYRK